MENPFPILYLTPLAHVVLRLTLGVTLLCLAFIHTRARSGLTASLQARLGRFSAPVVWLLIIGEGVLGGLFTIGLKTQYAALLLMCMAIDMLVLSRWSGHASIPSRLSYLFMFAMAASLFITGAGAFAVDLPI